TTPAPASCSRTERSVKIAFSVLFSLSMTVPGVPRGANTPYHVVTSWPGTTPDSMTVGTSGTAGKRSLPVTASALSSPDWTCPISADTVSSNTSTCRPRTEEIASWRIAKRDMHHLDARDLHRVAMSLTAEDQSGCCHTMPTTPSAANAQFRGS